MSQSIRWVLFSHWNPFFGFLKDYEESYSLIKEKEKKQVNKQQNHPVLLKLVAITSFQLLHHYLGTWNTFNVSSVSSDGNHTDNILTADGKTHGSLSSQPFTKLFFIKAFVKLEYSNLTVIVFN